MIDNKKPMLVSRLDTSQAPQSSAVNLAHAALRAIVEPHRKNGQQQDISAGASDTMRRKTELRKSTRYQLNSAVIIRWLGADGEIHEAFGAVHDISTCGVFVESATTLRTSTNIELEITSPNPKPSPYDLELRFEGKVVRSGKRKGREGFAVAGFLYVSRLWGLGC
jgi:hypothetical protein